MNYKINELAKLLNVSTNTVRRYERFGHIKSIRNENNGYRYYNMTDINRLMAVKVFRNFGFAHNDIVKMKNYRIDELIEMYSNHIHDIDNSITHSLKVRNRLMDDLATLKSVNTNKNNLQFEYKVSYSYVLYQSGDKILTDKNRRTIIHKYLYATPKVHMIYIIRKESVEEGNLLIHIGWALKISDLDELSMEMNEYVESYQHMEALTTLLKIPTIVNGISNMNKEQMYDICDEPMKYMGEHNLSLAGDIMGIKIATVYEESCQMEYVLFYFPITSSNNREEVLI